MPVTRKRSRRVARRKKTPTREMETPSSFNTLLQRFTIFHWIGVASVLGFVYFSLPYVWTLNYEWIYLKAVLPIFTPTPLIWFFSGLQLVRKRDDEKILARINYRHALMPSIWLIYTLITCIDIGFTMARSRLVDGNETLYSGIVILGFASAVMFGVLTESTEHTDPEARSESQINKGLLAVMLLMAIVAAILSYFVAFELSQI